MKLQGNVSAADPDVFSSGVLARIYLHNTHSCLQSLLSLLDSTKLDRVIGFLRLLVSVEFLPGEDVEGGKKWI